MLPDVPLHADDNPLLRSDEFQDYSGLTVRKCYDGVVRRALDFEAGFWRVEKHIKGKENMSEVDLFQEYLCPIEELSRPLENAYNVVKILRQSSDLMNSEKYGKVASRAALALHNKYSSPLLYYSCKSALKQSTSLQDDQKRLLKKYTLLGKLNGLELSNSNYEALMAVRKETLKNQTTYNNKLEHEARLFKFPISDPHMMKNVPQHLLKAMSEGPDPSRGPWGVQFWTMEPFIEYCPDALVRDKLWHSRVTFGLNNELTVLNAEVDQIRHSRRREAKILGFESYADYAMESKMAGSVENTLNMLDHLLEKARPAQAHEIESLNKFAFQSGFHKPLAFWDVGFWKHEQLNKTYNLDENYLSAYFPLENVLDGLFSLLNDLYGVEIHEKTGVNTWHRDVRVFEVFDKSSTLPSGHVFLDPYARPEKPYSGGVALTLRNRSLVGSGQSPQVGVVFSFSPPSSGKPCLLSFNNVVNLFARFGYAAQVVLSKSAYAEVAGTSFMESDAAEVPAHFMVHWAFNPSVVQRISGHYETGEKLPDTALNNLDKVRRHMAGFSLCNEIYKCRLDLELFATDIPWKSVMDELWPRYSALPQDPLDHSPMSFYQIFNDASASYYADLWSRVIAADIFTAFEEVGVDNKEGIRTQGERFRDLYLTGLSGSAENFRRFRGRDPSPDAFLLWLGLQKPLKQSK